MRTEARHDGGFAAVVPTYVRQAACASEDHPLFFSEDEAEQQRAKDICARCPVRIPCFVDALERGETYGVWGGTTPAERAKLTKARPAPAVARS